MPKTNLQFTEPIENHIDVNNPKRLPVDLNIANENEADELAKHPERLWLSPPHMCGEELRFIHEAFDLNWIAPLGPHVDALEKEMCEYVNAKHAAALSSGTAAIHLALIILGVKSGDEVICQSFTFSGSANPIMYQQALPIFIDSERDSWNMDPELLEEAIKDRLKAGRRPKSVIVVHLYGQPAKMEEIGHICKKYGIPLIEDAAEALGSMYKGQKASSIGDLGILSFNGNKIITTSGGGMLLSDNESIIQQARFLSTQARDAAPHYEHTMIGYNYRMSNVLAAIGLGQLRALNDRLHQKRRIFDYYYKRLSGIEGIEFQTELPGTFSNRWLTAITIDENKTGTDREKLRLIYEKANIDSRPLWKPMHLQPVFRGAPAYINGVSEYLFENGLCLPSGTAMTEKDLDRVCRVIEDHIG
jgi:dTDP-4-amino-4,6-dideoxygalactose transaminase